MPSVFVVTDRVETMQRTYCRCEYLEKENAALKSAGGAMREDLRIVRNMYHGQNMAPGKSMEAWDAACGEEE